MQIPPIGVYDFALLLAINSIILLITAEFASPKYGPIYFLIKNSKLGNLALALGIIALVFITIYLRTNS